MKISYSIILVISLLLIGCGSDKEATKEKQPAKVLAPHLKTLNQAKNMAKTLQDAEAARKKKMDEQEEGVEGGAPN